MEASERNLLLLYGYRWRDFLFRFGCRGSVCVGGREKIMVFANGPQRTDLGPQGSTSTGVRVQAGTGEMARRA
jgi:hypothetical protein